MNTELTVGLIAAAATLIAAIIGNARLSPKAQGILIFFCILISGLLIFIAIPKDEWIKWEKDFQDSFFACKDKTCKKAVIANAIDKIPSSDSRYQLSELSKEFRAGSVLLTHGGDFLAEDFGIQGNSYLGTGISVSKVTARNSGGLLEYWAPNLPETHEAVWTWILEPAFVDGNKTVRQALETPPTPTSDGSNFKFKDCIDASSIKFSECDFQSKLDSETRPILFRCAQFDEDNYSHFVGRKESVRVFFARLRDVYDLKIADACARTGRVTTNTEDGANQGRVEKYFVWIFIPSHEDQAIPATWGNLFSRFKKWEKM